MMHPTTAPRAPAPARPELAILAPGGPATPKPKPRPRPRPPAPLPLPAPTATTAAPSRTDRNLTTVESKTLDDLIRAHPGEPDSAIARRFAAAASRTVSRAAVNARRARIRRRAGAPTAPPLDAREVAILREELVLCGAAATSSRVAQCFEARTGRKLGINTVERYRGRATRPAPVAAWPAWTDRVRCDLPWADDDVIDLGPASSP